MTRKDYKMLAKIIKQNIDSQEKDYLHLNNFVADLIVELKKDNQYFDGFRFQEAIKK